MKLIGNDVETNKRIVLLEAEEWEALRKLAAAVSPEFRNEFSYSTNHIEVNLSGHLAFLANWSDSYRVLDRVMTSWAALAEAIHSPTETETT